MPLLWSPVVILWHLVLLVKFFYFSYGNSFFTYYLYFLLIGLFAKFLFDKYTIKTVAWAGGLVFFVGGFLTIFVTQVWHLIITYGIMQGIV